MSDTAVLSFTPTLSLPLQNENLQDIQGFKLWVSIPANDETGVVIDNVMPGDQVMIYDVSGICSFKSTSMAMVKAIVGVANAVAGDVLMYATEGAAAPFVEAWNTSLKTISNAVGDSDIKHGRRDAYGRDPGTGDYAKNEGGLIVCMPTSKGAIYATNDYYLTGDTKNLGRKESLYSAATKNANAFFPCNVSGGLLSRTAKTSGAVHILAFDEKFTDNAGAYNVGIIVVRNGNNVDDITQQLTGAGPSF